MSKKDPGGRRVVPPPARNEASNRLRASAPGAREPAGVGARTDGRDAEIARLRAMVTDLTTRNELLMEAIRKLQEGLATTRDSG